MKLSNTRVLIAGDHKLFRDGLHLLLDKQKGIEVIGTAGNSQTAIQLASQLKPHVVVISLNIDGMDGIDATQEIVAKCPQTKIVALSNDLDKQLIDGMLNAGVSAFLLKDNSIEELFYAINEALANRTYFCQEVASTVVRRYLNKNVEKQAVRPLTGREKQVLQHLADGRKAYQIAAKLQIGTKTVGTYRRNIMKKLNLNSTADLIKYAIRNGIINLE